MITTIKVSNITCVGCNNAVLKSLSSLVGVFGANVDMVNGNIAINHTDEIDQDAIVAYLIKLGFLIETQI